jgi:hypothetical protein
MPPLQAIFYREPGDVRPVAVFAESLNDREKWVVLDQHIDRLNTLTAERPWLPEPHCAPVSADLWELRCPVQVNGNGAGVGVAYGVHESYAVLLHAYAGTGKSRPPDATQVAQQRWDDFAARAASDDDSPYGGFAP